MIASLAVAAAAIGCLIWPAQFAPNESISVATAPVPVVDQVTPESAAPQADLRSSASDAETPLGSAAAASPGPTASSETTSSENSSDISAASPAKARLSAAVDVPGPRARKTPTLQILQQQHQPSHQT